MVLDPDELTDVNDSGKPAVHCCATTAVDSINAVSIDRWDITSISSIAFLFFSVHDFSLYESYSKKSGLKVNYRKVEIKKVFLRKSVDLSPTFL